MRLLVCVLALFLAVDPAIAAKRPRQYRVHYHVVRIADGVETTVALGDRRVSDRVPPLPAASLPPTALAGDEPLAFVDRPLPYVERSVREIARSLTRDLRDLSGGRLPAMADAPSREPDLTFDASGERWTYRWTRPGDPPGVSYRLAATITPDTRR